METFTRGSRVSRIRTQGLRRTPMGLYIKIKTEQRHEETHWHYADYAEPKRVRDGAKRHEWRRGSVNRNGGRRAVRGHHI